MPRFRLLCSVEIGMRELLPTEYLLRECWTYRSWLHIELQVLISVYLGW